ncbi:MAG: V-type ATP synthase subunit C [bacterium]
MKGKKTDYAHSVTRVRALERGLLDKGKIERMAEARDATEAIKILSETAYQAQVSRISSPYEYEDILRSEISAVRQLFWKISPHPELTDLFFLKYDVLNLKILIKGQYLQQDVSDILVTSGTVAPDEMKAMVGEGKFKELPSEIAQAAEEAQAALKETADPQLVDTTLDKAYYAYLSRFLSEHKQSFLQDFVALQADLTNIKSFIRVRHVAEDDGLRARELLGKVFIPGGKLKLDFFLAELDESLTAFADRFSRDPWGYVVADGVAAWEQEGSLTMYEKLADNFLLSYMKETSLIAFGPEPLVAYLWAKENEAKLIRIVMVGKINGLPADDIKERLRDVYA